MSELGQQAEEYAKAGWYVFPIKPRDKTPLTPHGLNDATIRIDIIRRWWEKAPQANIGLNCGKSGLIAIDLDKHGEQDGLTQWETLTQRYGLNPMTAISLTGGGGRHLLFRIPQDCKIKNSAGKLAPGIDVRGAGGYVVLPPSIHPNGKPYAWSDDVAIEPLPLPILDLLTREPDPWQVFTLKDAFAPRDPLIWIVEGIISEGSLSIWYGAPGTLKSMFLSDMAVSVAAGYRWLTQPDNPMTGLVTAPGAVLWLDFDNGQRRTHERFAALARARNLSDSTPVYYVSMPSPMLADEVTRQTCRPALYFACALLLNLMHQHVNHVVDSHALKLFGQLARDVDKPLAAKDARITLIGDQSNPGAFEYAIKSRHLEE